MDIALVIAFVGALIFLAHLFVGIFRRTKIPDVLLLILIGLFIGPILGIVSTADFGGVGPVFTIVTLVVILFESGIGLDLGSLKKALKSTLTLTTLNFLATMIVVGLLTLILTDLEPISAFMLGAIIGGTSSAVVIPLVEQLEMHEESKAILLLESAVSDVLCIVVALAFLEIYKVGEIHLGLVTGHLLSTFLLAILFGVMGALLWSMFLHRMRSLENSIFTTLAFVFVIYGIVKFLGYSGAIASLAFGITMENMKSLRLPLLKKRTPFKPIAFNETEKAFFSEIVFLLKTFFFVYVGLSIQLTNQWWITVGTILTIMIFLLRIVVVSLSVPKYIPKKDASLMAVIVPKGLAAAVLASIPMQEGIVGGELIQSVTFAAILFSIILTSLLIFLLDRTRLSRFYGKIYSDFGSSHKPIVGNRRSTNRNSNDNHK